jgi:hypothetical protein
MQRRKLTQSLCRGQEPDARCRHSLPTGKYVWCRRAKLVDEACLLACRLVSVMASTARGLFWVVIEDTSKLNSARGRS